MIGVLGVIDDVRAAHADRASRRDGDVVLLLGATRDELGGSEWAHVVHGHLGGRPPRGRPARRARARRGAGQPRPATGCSRAAHDLSDGGLAQALVEMAAADGTGAPYRLPAALDPFVALFSESSARAVVAVAPERLDAFLVLCGRHLVPVTRLGTTGGADLVLDGPVHGAGRGAARRLAGHVPRPVRLTRVLAPLR